MDEKYIENLGMSPHIDEGLWDRLKSRVSAFTQGAKNISGFGNVGTTESAKFNSLFRNFVNTELSLIRSTINALQPWVQHATDDEMEQYWNLQELDYALKRINLGKLPVTEALPTFSNLGARAKGGFQNILDSYKARIASAYENFLNDVRKMNIVPEQYITRKIVSAVPGAKEALEALEKVIEKPILGLTPPTVSSAPAPAHEPPKTPAPTPSPVPTTPEKSAATTSEPFKSPSPVSSTGTEPKGSTPPATPTKVAEPPKPPPSSSTAAPTDLPKGTEKKAPPASTAATSAPTPSGSETLSDKAKDNILDLIRKSIASITAQLKSGELGKKIGGYIKRDASKAEYIFPGKVSTILPNGDRLYWHFRYKLGRDMIYHHIEYLPEVFRINPETGKPVSLGKETRWKPLLIFKASDLFDMDGNLRTDFDVIKNISSVNPELQRFLKDITVDSKTTAELVDSLARIPEGAQPEPERGERHMVIPPEKIGSGEIGTPEPPIEPPTGKEKMINPPPEKHGRVEKIPAPPEAKPEKPPKKAEEPPKTAGKTAPAEKPEKPKSKIEPKPEAPKSEPSTKLKDLVPKKKAPTKKPAEKPIEKPETPKTPKADPAVAAPKHVEPSKPTVVAPAKPTEPVKSVPTPPTDEEKLARFNAKYLAPYGLSPFTSPDQIKAFWDAVGVTGPGEVPDWKIKGAHQVVTGKKPITPSPSSEVKPTKKKIKEGFDYRDFFSL